MALYLALYTDLKIGKKPSGSRVTDVRRPAAPVTPNKLLQPLHKRDGGPVFFVQGLADAIGETHRRTHAWSCLYFSSSSSLLSVQSGFGTMQLAGQTSLHCGSSSAPTHSVHFIGSIT